MAKAIRDVYGETLKKYGETNENIVVLDADVSSSTKSAVFGKAYPDRFYNCGISEYAMMGIAAGMAKSGKIPFVNTFAVFLTTLGSLAARTFMSYSGLPIKMMGGYGGLSDAFDGATHHALEDIAMMRTLPNIQVLVASDAQITDWMVKYAIETPEPMYIRLSRDAAPDCHPADAKFEIGKGMVVKEGTDVAIIACGLMVSTALTAAEQLAAKGINAKVVDMYSIKPIDAELIVECAKCGAIVTAEEHSVIGGLGGAVAEVLAKEGCAVPTEMVGMMDRHGESGPYKSLLKKYGLDADAVAAAAEKAVSRK
ncbi:MAG: transketolase family protein [Clostridiales bacterium]|nr:transketolase family protein [Clostridiales bacterium]